MNKPVVKEIKFILDKLMDDGDDDRLGWASRTLVYNLDKLVRNYHKALAIQSWIVVNKGWWFMELAGKFPLVQYTRDAVEILVDVASHANHTTIMTSTSLCDIYSRAINKFYEEIVQASV
jgi:hypothetical protein